MALLGEFLSEQASDRVSPSVQELPAVEEVSVMLPEEAELQPAGTISSIIQQLGKRTHTHIQPSAVSPGVRRTAVTADVLPVSTVVVQSLKDTPALTDESILFRSDRLALAKVSDPQCIFLH